MDETYKLQEVYLDLKQRLNDGENQFKMKINSMVQVQQKLKIEIEEVTQEKKAIMRRLVETMVAYDKETSEKYEDNYIEDSQMCFYEIPVGKSFNRGFSSERMPMINTEG